MRALPTLLLAGLALAAPGIASAQNVQDRPWQGYVSISLSRSTAGSPADTSVQYHQILRFSATKGSDSGPGGDRRIWTQSGQSSARLRDVTTWPPSNCPSSQTIDVQDSGPARLDVDINGGYYYIAAGRTERVPIDIVTTCPGQPASHNQDSKDLCAAIGTSPVPQLAPAGTETLTLSGSYAPHGPGDHYYVCDGAYWDAQVSWHLTRSPDPPACADGVDNDQDGRTDYSGGDPAYGDPGCTGPKDDTEADPPPCKSSAALASRWPLAFDSLRTLVRKVYPKRRVLKLRVRCPDCESAAGKAKVVRGRKVIGRFQAERITLRKGRGTLKFVIPEALYYEIAEAVLDKRRTVSPLRVSGRSPAGERARFKRLKARYVRVALSRGAAASQCPPPQWPPVLWVAVNTPDIAAGAVKG